eukprot:scaffold6260_cov79-Cyclotella_meneghiniana.AAC.4
MRLTLLPGDGNMVYCSAGCVDDVIFAVSISDVIQRHYSAILKSTSKMSEDELMKNFLSNGVNNYTVYNQFSTLTEGNDDTIDNFRGGEGNDETTGHLPLEICNYNGITIDWNKSIAYNQFLQRNQDSMTRVIYGDRPAVYESASMVVGTQSMCQDSVENSISLMAEDTKAHGGVGTIGQRRGNRSQAMKGVIHESAPCCVSLVSELELVRDWIISWPKMTVDSKIKSGPDRKDLLCLP